MRWLFILFFVLQTAVLCHAQLKLTATKVNAAQLTKNIKYSGKLKEAWQWRDTLGSNILVLSITDITYGPGEDEQSIRLYAYHYCTVDTGTRLVWKLNDQVGQCPVDITLEYLPGATSITDLDGDGIAETTVIYKGACRGDVSPAEMKLIMHEDSVKYALRGTMWSPYASGDSVQQKFPVTESNVNLETLEGYKGTEEEYYKEFGRYRTQKGFRKAPASFLVFARRQWLRFAIESFE